MTSEGKRREDATAASGSASFSRTNTLIGSPGQCLRRKAVVASLLLDQLDAIAVRVAHETKARTTLPDGVRRLLRLDPLFGQPRQHLIEVVDRNRNVVVARPELVGIDPVVVGELEPGAVAGEAHEDVD